MSDFQADTSTEAIGRRLGAVRAARGLTQAALASALEISPTRWNNYEGGKTRPPPEVLIRFWQVTGGSADFVLFGRIDTLSPELAKQVLGLSGADVRKSPQHPKTAS